MKKHKTAETSLLAYDDMKEFGQSGKVKDLILKHIQYENLRDRYPTRQDIADNLRMRLATVCGAVRPLLEEKRISVHSYVTNAETKKKNETLHYVLPTPPKPV